MEGFLGGGEPRGWVEVPQTGERLFDADRLSPHRLFYRSNRGTYHMILSEKPANALSDVIRDISSIMA